MIKDSILMFILICVVFWSLSWVSSLYFDRKKERQVKQSVLEAPVIEHNDRKCHPFGMNNHYIIYDCNGADNSNLLIRIDSLDSIILNDDPLAPCIEEAQ